MEEDVVCVRVVGGRKRVKPLKESLDRTGDPIKSCGRVSGGGEGGEEEKAD